MVTYSLCKAFNYWLCSVVHKCYLSSRKWFCFSSQIIPVGHYFYVNDPRSTSAFGSHRTTSPSSVARQQFLQQYSNQGQGLKSSFLEYCNGLWVEPNSDQHGIVANGGNATTPGRGEHWQYFLNLMQLQTEQRGFSRGFLHEDYIVLVVTISFVRPQLQADIRRISWFYHFHAESFNLFNYSFFV